MRSDKLIVSIWNHCYHKGSWFFRWWCLFHVDAGSRAWPGMVAAFGWARASIRNTAAPWPGSKGALVFWGHFFVWSINIFVYYHYSCKCLLIYVFFIHIFFMFLRIVRVNTCVQTRPKYSPASWRWNWSLDRWGEQDSVGKVNICKHLKVLP